MSLSKGVPRISLTCSLAMPVFSCDTMSCVTKLPCWISIRYGVMPGIRGMLHPLRTTAPISAPSARFDFVMGI